MGQSSPNRSANSAGDKNSYCPFVSSKDLRFPFSADQVLMPNPPCFAVCCSSKISAESLESVIVLLVSSFPRFFQSCKSPLKSICQLAFPSCGLKVSNLCSKDAIFVMSVGGGRKKKNVSVNLIKAIDYSKKKGATVLGIVGRDGGYTKKFGDLVVVVPTVDKKLVTPYSESFHSVVWHCLVSHPLLQIKKMKW